jgi:hypothetical protein
MRHQILFYINSGAHAYAGSAALVAQEAIDIYALEMKPSLLTK